MTPAISVSLDGGVTWQQADEGVRVRLQGVDVPGEDEPGDLDFNIGHEGVITDVWVTRDDPGDHNIATSSVLHGDLISDLIERDA